MVQLALLWAAVAGAQTSSTPITTGVIQGMVIDPAGAVIVEAHVTATEESTARAYTAKTDASGQYQFAALPAGKYAVRCEMRQFKTAAKTSVAVSAGQVLPLNFQLAVGAYEDSRGPGPAMPVIVEPTGAPVQIQPYTISGIAGLVSDPVGTGIPQARVTIIDETSRRYQTGSSCSGLYLLRLRAGHYSAHIEASAFRPQTKTSIRVVPDLVTLLDPVLQVAATSDSEIAAGERLPTGMITGTVKGPDGASVFAKITARKTSGEGFEAATDSYGVYILAGLPAGSYEVSFAAGEIQVGSYRRALVRPPAPTCLDALASPWAGIQVSAGPSTVPEDGEVGAITGYVIDPAAAVIPGAMVTATDESTARVHTTRTNDSGLYRMSLLAPGKYTVRCEMQGFKTETRTSVIVNQSQVARVDVRLEIGSHSGPEITSGPMIPRLGR
jgi:hypothetical protein